MTCEHANSLLDGQLFNSVKFRYGYQLSGKGKWISLELKRPKAKQKVKTARKPGQPKGGHWADDSDNEAGDGSRQVRLGFNDIKVFKQIS